MNKIWLSAGLVAAVALIVAGISYQSMQSSKLSPTDNLEACNSLVYSSPDAINLLFFSSKKDAEVYSSYLLDKKPFDSNKDKFNIYYIDNYSPECTHYNGIALFCDSHDLTLKSSSCPHDYVFVLKKDEMSIRSSAYGIVGSINTAHPLTVIEHEFGHLFANFAEEYIPATLPSGQPNCKSKCSELGDLSSSCFSECSDSSHYRSIKNGVMRTLDSDKYGDYNEKTISSVISTLMSKRSTNSATGLVTSDPSDCSNNNQLVITAHYSGQSLILDSAEKKKGCAPQKNIGPSETAISEHDQTISSYNTPDFRNIFTDAPPSNNNDPSNTINGETFQSEDSFSFSIPFSPGDSVQSKNSNTQSPQLSLSTIGATPCRIE